jgi:large subunit ribosomal protein L25
MITLQYEKRDAKTKADMIRKTGKVPAVFYGPKEKSTAITLKETEFKKAWKDAGESTIVILKNGAEEHETLIHDVDIHPVTGMPRHADFYVIEKGKKLQVDVELEFEGVSPAVKDMGGILIKVLHELEIEAMPKDLPHDIKVDIGLLTGLESQILAKDLKLPAGVTLITGPEEVVAAIAVAKEEVEEPTKTIDDIEVVGAKGKEETAEGDEAAPAKAEDKKDKKAEDKK